MCNILQKSVLALVDMLLEMEMKEPGLNFDLLLPTYQRAQSDILRRPIWRN